MNETIDPKAAAIEYEQLKIQEKQVKARLAILQPIVLPLIPEGQNVMMKEGYFYIQMRTDWKFSDAVTKAEEQVEKMKEDEKADGTATPKQSPTLYYRAGEPKEHEIKE